MKLKWYWYITTVYEAVALIVKCGGVKKAIISVDKEHARLQKEMDTGKALLAGIYSKNEILKMGKELDAELEVKMICSQCSFNDWVCNRGSFTEAKLGLIEARKAVEGL